MQQFHATELTSGMRWQPHGLVCEEIQHCYSWRRVSNDTFEISLNSSSSSEQCYFRWLEEFPHTTQYAVDISGTVMGESPDGLLLSGLW